MLPLVESEVVAHGWMDEQDIVNFIAVSESTPGSFAVNVATYVGEEVAGIAGSVCATLGVVLPSFIIILIIAGCYKKFRDSGIIKGCMSGLKPAVVGLIGASVISVGREVFIPDGLAVGIFKAAGTYVSAGILVIALILSFKSTSDYNNHFKCNIRDSSRIYCIKIRNVHFTIYVIYYILLYYDIKYF